MPDDTFLTLAAPAEGLYKEKGSKFLAFAFPVNSEAEVRSILEKIRKDYFDARHHCYAYILGAKKESYRINDDGEPSGTAGKPIYGQLLSKNLTNTLVVVVRYFGGILLGTSGLFAAYKLATQDALNQASIVEETVKSHLKINFQYLQMNDVMKLLKQYNLTPQNQSFNMDCTLEVYVRQSKAKNLEEELLKIDNLHIEKL